MNKTKLVFPVGAGLFVDGYELTITASIIILIPHFWISDIKYVSLIGSSSVLGTIIGAFLAGPLSDIYGRSRFLIIDMLFVSIFSILSSFSWDINSLLIFRFLTGLAIGADYPLSSAYLAELLSKEKRGKYLAITIGFWMFGAITAAVLGYLFVIAGYSWRYLLAIGAIFPLLIIFFRRMVIYEERNFLRSGVISFLMKLKASAGEGYKKIVLITVPRFILDFTGYTFHLYLPFIILYIGVHSKSTALLINLIFMLSFVVGWIPCFLYIDKIGRITLQIIGFLGSALSMFVVFLVSSFSNTSFYMIIILLFYQFFTFLGPGVTAWILPVELFDHNNRSTWQSISTLIAHAGGFLAAFIVPSLIKNIGFNYLFLILTAGGISAAIITFVFKEETMQKELN